jgi:hypothetical protein
MAQLIIAIMVLSLAVAVPFKAKNPEADLPSCVIDGLKLFFIDLKAVLTGLKGQAEKKSEGKKEEAKEKAESEATEVKS